MSQTVSQNPWSALMESLHSALIDELNARWPEQKPTLGLPKRDSQFVLPATDACVVTVSIGGSPPGLAALALDPSLTKGGQSAQKLWSAVTDRARVEFAHRKISPAFGNTATKAPSDVRPSRVIWIPIRVDAGQLWLGVGI